MMEGFVQEHRITGAKFGEGNGKGIKLVHIVQGADGPMGRRMIAQALMPSYGSFSSGPDFGTAISLF